MFDSHCYYDGISDPLNDLIYTSHAPYYHIPHNTYLITHTTSNRGERKEGAKSAENNGECCTASIIDTENPVGLTFL